MNHYKNMITVLAACLWIFFSSCTQAGRVKINIREFAFNDSGLRVITNWMNEKAGTVSVLYGNASAWAYSAKGAGHHLAGEEYQVATFALQGNPFWYGSKINGALQHLETIAMMPQANGPKATYGIRYFNQGRPTFRQTDTATRIDFILNRPASLFP